MALPYQLLVLDIDGVLTDGTVDVAGDGRRVFLRDLDALIRARQAGLEVAFLTGEAESSTGTLVARCGGGLVRYGSKDKESALKAMAAEADVPLGSICYVGDAERDVPALRCAGLGLAPADASQAAREAADRVLTAVGGHGAVEEAVGILLPGARGVPRGLERGAFVALVSAELAESAGSLAEFVGEWDANLAEAAAAIGRALAAGRRVILCGEAESAALAQHVAAELAAWVSTERRPLPVLALTVGGAVPLALDNHYGFERILERQVEAFAQSDDVIVGLSTTGGSESVTRALVAGRRLGALTIAFVGACQGPIGDAAEIPVVFPPAPPARVHEMHLAALHAIFGAVEASFTPQDAAGGGS